MEHRIPPIEPRRGEAYDAVQSSQESAIKNSRPVPLSFLLLIVGVSSLFFPWRSARAQAPAPNPPVVYDALQQFHLISPGVGWVATSQLAPSSDCPDCTDEHLYWTQNNGQDWRDITPQRTPQQNIQQAFFLSDGHGWVALEDPRKEDDKVVTLARTSDAGANWETLASLSDHAFGFMNETAPSQIFFSDSLHGWMLWTWAQATVRADYLLATSDGGRTWRRLPPPPGGGPIQFVSSLEGWMIGVLDHPAPGFRGVDPESAQLFNSHDGGRTWRPVPQSLVPVVDFAGMNFKSQLEGVIVLRISFSATPDSLGRYFACATTDGGRNWQFSPFDAKEAAPSIIDSRVLWFTSDKGTRNITIKRGDAAAPSSLPDVLWPGGSATGSFVDDSNGWVEYSARPTGRNASGTNSKSQGDAAPTLSDLLGVGQGEKVLLSTTDGGKTFHIITPPSGVVPPAPNR